jgi:HPt (histidine-containing phosphotransfer) domain-containing protein
MELVVEEFVGQREVVLTVMDQFLDNVRGQLKTMADALADGRGELIAREAHAIKGGAANLTAHRLSQTAKTLEEQAKAGQWDHLGQTLARLQSDADQLQCYMADWLAANQPG